MLLNVFVFSVTHAQNNIDQNDVAKYSDLLNGYKEIISIYDTLLDSAERGLEGFRSRTKDDVNLDNIGEVELPLMQVGRVHYKKNNRSENKNNLWVKYISLQDEIQGILNHPSILNNPDSSPELKNVYQEFFRIATEEIESKKKKLKKIGKIALEIQRTPSLLTQVHRMVCQDSDIKLTEACIYLRP